MALITTGDVENWLKSGGFDGTVHNANIDRVTATAIKSVVRYCGRSFDTTAVDDETARVYGVVGRGQWRGIECSSTAVVHDIWDTTNLLIETDDGDSGTYTAWDAGDYTLEPLNQLDGDSYTPYWRIRSVNGRSFPTGNRRPALRVTAAWGWDETELDDVKQAALMKAAKVFTRKDSPQGVAGFGDFGVVRISNRTDPDVADLLNPFRHPLATALVA